MQPLKGVLVVLIGLFAVVTIMSLFIPSKVVTVRGMPIHAEPNVIMKEIADLKSWRNWHPVFMADSLAKFSEPSTGVGASVTWVSNKKTITIKVTESSEVGIKFLVLQPGELPVDNILSIAPLQDKTGYQIEWQALTHLKWYPWEKFAGIFTDKMTGPGYEYALDNLRKHIEGHP